MNIKYVLNGETVSESEFQKRGRERAQFLKATGSSLEDVLATENGSADRKALTSTIGFTEHWHSHESLSAGVPIHQAKEHADWIKKNKIVGVEVIAKPEEHCAVVRASDRGSFDRYLAERGLVNVSSGGGGSHGSGGGSTKPKSKYRSWMNPKKKGKQRVA